MFEQCIDLPRAISTSEGELNNGTKANTTSYFIKSATKKQLHVFINKITGGWVPLVVIMEEMIRIAPLDAHKTIGSYAYFLLKQHVTYMYCWTTQRALV